MTAVIQSSVGFALRRLPQWLVRALDGWSQRVAQRRSQERQRKWLARKAPAALPAQVYHLKPWRD